MDHLVDHRHRESGKFYNYKSMKRTTRKEILCHGHQGKNGFMVFQYVKNIFFLKIA